MSVQKPTTYDGAFLRQVRQGDLNGAGEIPANLATVGAGTLTAAILANNIINRTGPAGAVADTVDTASNIINAIMPANSGDTWRIKYINNTAFAITVTGVTGVTVTNGIVNATSVKEFLVTLNNATPTSVVNGNITNASLIVTGLTSDQTNKITTGQLVVGTGITAGTKVASVQSGIGVTLDTAATATATATQLTFNPQVTILGLGQGLI